MMIETAGISETLALQPTYTILQRRNCEEITKTPRACTIQLENIGKGVVFE
jgi:hypothetical protein